MVFAPPEPVCYGRAFHERTMSLSAFIRAHEEEIIREFAVFAKTLMPPGADMTEVELRDHAEEMLAAIVEDIGTPQTAEEQSRKSKGHGSARVMEASGRLHADDRIQHGYTFRSVLAEFRALRAAVLRLYEESGQTDLTDVRRFNEAVDEALTESMDRFARQMDRFRHQFIGILSHDLRTPLAAVTAGAAILAMPDDHPEQRAWVAPRILSSARRMERMIADLLDLASARLGGSIPVKRRPANLRQVCEDALVEIRAVHPKAVVRLEAHGDLDGRWDPDRLAQVVSNLAGNAIQYGDGTPVTLRCHDHGDAVTLAVHNGGPAIPADLLPMVFEPLTRGREADGSHSIGLGLFIARAIVAAHGGQIQVSSSDDAGTTFVVKLPKAL